MYIATSCPARDETASYVTYGNSAIINPWGKVVAQAGIDETIIYSDIGKPLIKSIEYSNNLQ